MSRPARDASGTLPRAVTDERDGRDGRGGRMPRAKAADQGAFSVVHLTAEYWPFAQAGGLAEAVRGLGEFQATGRNVYVILPLYRSIREANDLVPVTDEFKVPLGAKEEPARLFQLAKPPRGPRVLFLEHQGFFDRAGIYGDSGADYPDNGRRWAFFCRAALEALPRIVTGPAVLHAHDWHAALSAVYLRTVLAGQPFYDSLGTVLTVHNAGFHGHFPEAMIPGVGLPAKLYDWRWMEWYGRANWLKGGLSFADIVTTVSPTHAVELRSDVGGFGLHDLFVGLGERLVGILNGIDQGLWDPETDPQITANYTAKDTAAKARCKTAAQRGFGLPLRAGVPLFAMSSRLVAQKGLDLLIHGAAFFERDLQLVILGEGEQRYRVALTTLAEQLPEQLSVEFNFHDRLEHRLMAGADLLLMPSLYEPCGLTQMRAMRYGTIPVARSVGGLADTIRDGVNGFLFDLNTPAALDAAVARALRAYKTKARWKGYMKEGMRCDYGWEQSAGRYLEVYRQAMAAHVSAR